MKTIIVNNVAEMSELASQWSFAERVALVPTMGYLHEGHISLVREAARQAEKVIVSIFVNPLQFGPSEDYSKYPRDLDRDAALLASAGADVIFTPAADDITPSDMSFWVDPGPAGNVLCGRYRPGHFIGVSTIVCKLFQIVRPGQAVFGWKDAQQFLILKKMVKDLNIPVTMNALETIREGDGLAMSSRNSYLSPEERQAAPAIYEGLQKLRTAYQDGEQDARRLLDLFLWTVEPVEHLKIQYAEAVSMDKLEPVDKVEQGNTLVAVAVYAGGTRLIDNLRL